ASASAKPIAAAPSAGSAGAISCRASSASPPPRAESSARVSGSRRPARSPGFSLDLSDDAPQTRPSVLSPGDIRSTPYRFALCSCFGPKRRESQAAILGGRRSPLGLGVDRFVIVIGPRDVIVPLCPVLMII